MAPQLAGQLTLAGHYAQKAPSQGSMMIWRYNQHLIAVRMASGSFRAQFWQLPRLTNSDEKHNSLISPLRRVLADGADRLH